MRRPTIPLLVCLLVASLVLASAASGFLRTAHGISSAGQVKIVICGQDGAESVTLDRNGKPAEPAPTSCAHCADCALTSAADLPNPVAGPVRSAPACTVQVASAAPPSTLRPVRLAPRGPPGLREI